MINDTLSTSDFQRISDLVYRHSGIRLGIHKKALLVARLAKRMRQLGVSDFHAYYERVVSDSSGIELAEMIQAITTHVTHFFREPHHFELLTDWFRHWEEQDARHIRIWCAAASTGEEAYSVAMVARESLRDPSRLKILATDISTPILAHAKLGLYNLASLKETSRARVGRYFEPIRDGQTTRYQLSTSIMRMVRFAPINLANTPYPMKGLLDVILCRNVMIYFDNEVRKRILEEMYRLLKPSGYLLVGHAESLSGMPGRFTYVAPSIYTKE